MNNLATHKNIFEKILENIDSEEFVFKYESLHESEELSKELEKDLLNASKFKRVFYYYFQYGILEFFAEHDNGCFIYFYSEFEDRTTLSELTGKLIYSYDWDKMWRDVLPNDVMRELVPHQGKVTCYEKEY